MRRYVLSLAFVVSASSAMVVLAGSPAATGTIEGKVSYTGTPPKMKPIDMSKEPVCAKEHNPPELIQTVTTGPGNAIEYAVVYVSAGSGEETTPPSETVKFDQKGCMYMPHVLAMEVNQPLSIANNDPVAHNIHPMPKLNTEWNKSQPPGTPPIDTKWDKPEFISVKCNIHPWMHGTFAVLKNSHYAISDADGNFKLPNLPPGKYTVTAWHEPDQEMSQDVVISGSETKPITFVFALKPY